LCQAATPKDIEWVPRARWVVDGKVWSSSGVTAGARITFFHRAVLTLDFISGSDMALAFIEHLTSAEVARRIRGEFEIPEVTQMDDPFAEIYGLV
jgi:hypothetical protein